MSDGVINSDLKKKQTLKKNYQTCTELNYYFFVWI